MIDFESAVRELVGMGFDRAVAEAQVRGQMRIDAPPAASLSLGASADEKREQAEVVKLFRAYGGKVYSLSQARASKQTPGLPDLWVVFNGIRRAFWFETKRQVGGRLSDAQREFGIECTTAGVSWYVGDRRTAAEILIDCDLARPGNGPCGIVPIHEPRPGAAPLTQEITQQ